MIEDLWPLLLNNPNDRKMSVFNDTFGFWQEPKLLRGGGCQFWIIPFGFTNKMRNKSKNVLNWGKGELSVLKKIKCGYFEGENILFE